MNRRKRALTVIFSALYIFILLFSVLFIASEADHNCCVKESCPICYQISICNNVVKNVGSACPFVFILLACVFAVELIIGAKNGISASTLVMLKVKLSN